MFCHDPTEQGEFAEHIHGAQMVRTQRGGDGDGAEPPRLLLQKVLEMQASEIDVF